MPLIDLQKVARMQVESAYGTVPGAFTDAMSRYTEAFVPNANAESIRRAGFAGAWRPAFRPATGALDNPFAFSTEIVPFSADEPGSPPTLARGLHHEAMIMAGFGVDATVANQVSYNLLDTSHGSVGWEFYEHDETGAAGHLWTATGARANGIIKWNMGSRLMMDLVGNCATLTPVDFGAAISPVFQDSGYVAGILAPRCRLPYVALGVSGLVSAVDVAGANFPFLGDFLEMEIRLNNGLSVHRAANATGGITRVQLTPQPIEIDLTVEAGLFATWDPRFYRDEKSNVECTFTFVAADPTGGQNDYLDIVFTGAIENVEPSSQDGRKVWKLKMQGLFGGTGGVNCTPSTQLQLIHRTAP